MWGNSSCSTEKNFNIRKFKNYFSQKEKKINLWKNSSIYFVYGLPLSYNVIKIFFYTSKIYKLNSDMHNKFQQIERFFVYTIQNKMHLKLVSCLFLLQKYYNTFIKQYTRSFCYLFTILLYTIRYISIHALYQFFSAIIQHKKKNLLHLFIIIYTTMHSFLLYHYYYYQMYVCEVNMNWIYLCNTMHYNMYFD